jgi:DNA polymerase-3 subunit gamma/tau
VSNALLLFNEVLNNGFDGNHFINGLASHFRNLLVGKDPQTIQLLEVSENIKQKYLSQSKSADLGFILTALNLANQCDLVYKNSKNQRLQVELSLIKMCHIPSVIQLAQQPLTNANTATDPSQDKKKTLADTSPNQQTEQAKTTEVKQTPSLASIPEPVKAEEPKVEIVTPAPTAAPPVSRVSLPRPSSIKIEPPKPNATASLIPSLTDLSRIAKGEEEKGAQYVSGDEKEPFTEEAFLTHWKIYTQKAKENDKIHLFTLMTNEPIINGTEITVLVENLALESTLQEEKIDLLNYLRSALRNYDLQIGRVV